MTLCQTICFHTLQSVYPIQFWVSRCEKNVDEVDLHQLLVNLISERIVLKVHFSQGTDGLQPTHIDLWNTHTESRNQLEQFNQLTLTSRTHTESRHQLEQFNQLMLTTETCRVQKSANTIQPIQVELQKCGGSKILVTWPGHMTALLFFTIFSLNTTMTTSTSVRHSHMTRFLFWYFLGLSFTDGDWWWLGIDVVVDY